MRLRLGDESLRVAGGGGCFFWQQKSGTYVVCLLGSGVEAGVLLVRFLGEAVARLVHQAVVVERAGFVLLHDVQDGLRERAVDHLPVLLRKLVRLARGDEHAPVGAPGGVLQGCGSRPRS